MMDRRRTPIRHDIAAEHLRGQVEGREFVEGVPTQVGVSLLNLAVNADPNSGMATQLLFGEGFTVYDRIPDLGLSWGQSDRDGYVGYVASEGLMAPVKGQKQITALSALIYSKPDLKSQPVGAYSMGCRVAVEAEENGYARLGEGMFTPLVYLGPVAGDFVSVAEKFIGVPYLWGGRSYFGLDCSALVQISMQAVGLDAPRDSDMQAAELGEVISAPSKRGDLGFWDGHVGIMQDANTVLHANAHHMAVVSEPLADVVGRSAGPITVTRRL